MSTAAPFSLLTALLQRDAISALSMTDPFGTLVALGAKTIETRSWTTPYRGPLAIHVAKTLPPEAAACCELPHVRQALEAGGYSRRPEVRDNPWCLPLGQVIAIAWLDEVERITPAFQVEETERRFGLFTPGRYAWRFTQVYRLSVPLPARGALGVWEWQPPERFWEEIQAAQDRARKAVPR